MNGISLPFDSPWTYVIVFLPTLIILCWPRERWSVKLPFAVLSLVLSWLAALAFLVVHHLQRSRTAESPDRAA